MFLSELVKFDLSVCMCHNCAAPSLCPDREPCAQCVPRACRDTERSRENVNSVPATRRGVCLGGVVASTLGCTGTANTYEQARAATLELADVTPTITPPAPLRDAEKALINVFDASTRSVVNIFDLSLQGRNVQAQVVCCRLPVSPKANAKTIVLLLVFVNCSSEGQPSVVCLSLIHI